jgi:hypothetical protein
MNQTHDIEPADTAADDERELDPREAANLLEQTRRQAARRFDPRSPQLSLVGAAVVLVALGAVWLSVRDQHPYKGPTAQGLLALYGILFAWIGFAAIMTQRANAGVKGRSIRQQQAYGAVVVVALVAVSVYQGVLKHDGVSLSVVYGTYPLTAQLIVLGTVGATFSGMREDWPGFAVAIAIILVAAGSAFAGPRGVWLADGIGCCVVVLAQSGVQAWLRR